MPFCEIITLKSRRDRKRPFGEEVGFFNLKFQPRVNVVRGAVQFVCLSLVGCLEVNVIYVSFVWTDEAVREERGAF